MTPEHKAKYCSHITKLTMLILSVHYECLKSNLALKSECVVEFLLFSYKHLCTVYFEICDTPLLTKDFSGNLWSFQKHVSCKIVEQSDSLSNYRSDRRLKGNIIWHSSLYHKIVPHNSNWQLPLYRTIPYSNQPLSPNITFDWWHADKE